MFPSSEGNRVRDAGCGLPGRRLEVSGPLDPDGLPTICDRARRRSAGRDALTCDVAGVVPNLRAIDALARLQLNLRRRGVELRLEGAPRSLMALARLAGLDDVLPLSVRSAASRVDARGQPEEREQSLRVEEEDDPTDLAVGDVDDLQ